MAESKFTPLVCIYCSVVFTPTDKRQTFCSKNCKVKRWKRDNPRQYVRKPQYTKPRTVSTCVFGYCTNCRNAFYSRQSNVAFCCGDCSVVWATRAKHVKLAREVICAGCSSVFCPLYGSSHATTCAPCAEAAIKDGRANQRHRYRARKRNATVESVSPTRVFNACNWHCVYCGIETPRHLRGTTEPNAPELDHYRPLSKGGEHSYRNVMLLCRLCNLTKGDKLPEELVPDDTAPQKSAAF
jgi:5-methylcytosine-specific restriction endonuclease McrA